MEIAEKMDKEFDLDLIKKHKIPILDFYYTLFREYLSILRISGTLKYLEDLRQDKENIDKIIKKQDNFLKGIKFPDLCCADEIKNINDCLAQSQKRISDISDDTGIKDFIHHYKNKALKTDELSFIENLLNSFHLFTDDNNYLFGTVAKLTNLFFNSDYYEIKIKDICKDLKKNKKGRNRI